MIETFMKEEQAIFIVALFLLLFAIVMSYAMIQDGQEIINSKTKDMKKNFVKLRWFFTMLLLVTTMIINHDVGEKHHSTPPKGESTF